MESKLKQMDLNIREQDEKIKKRNAEIKKETEDLNIAKYLKNTNVPKSTDDLDVEKYLKNTNDELNKNLRTNKQTSSASPVKKLINQTEAAITRSQNVSNIKNPLTTKTKKR